MDKKAYLMSKKYTNDSVEGLGVIKGANCEIDSITPSADGKYNIVIFGWTGSAGTHMTSQMRVDNGEDGRSIKSADLDTDLDHKLHLIITYDDDTTKDAGIIPVPTVEVGTVETVDYEEGADVEDVPTASGIALNFKIPRGQDGASDPVWNII